MIEHSWRQWRPPARVPDHTDVTTRYGHGTADRTELCTIASLALALDGTPVEPADILTQRGIRIHNRDQTITVYYRDPDSGHVYRGTAPLTDDMLADALEIGHR